MTEFSVIMPLQGIAQWDNWLEGVSLKVTNYMENKNGRNKKYMETLIVLWIKCTDMLKKKKKKKPKDVIDAVPVMVPIMMQFQVLY